ncbi:SH3 domain-containing protein [Mesobacillus jeotgali]|uniref:SH3 domain-containing protein n=1 Tax=Mesobacillus jeotgali TaxID=129985 RepID=UPI000C854472|nr:SH3 domain-containing protein [Mesobacillus jeotgali]
MEHIAAIWMMLPIWGRGAVLLLVLLLILRPLMLKSVPKLLKGLIIILEKMVYFVFYTFISLLGFYVSALVKKGRKNFQGINKVETNMQNIITNLKSMPSKVTFTTGKGSKSFRYYKMISLAVAGLIAFTIFYWPQTTLSQKWDSIDLWMIEEKMKQPRIHYKVALENMKTKLSEEEKESITASAEAQADPIRMKLIKEKTGGAVRKDPVKSLSTKNVITQIGPGEEVIFLKEQQKLGNITWYKIKTANGKIGWISSNILEEVK